MQKTLSNGIVLLMLLASVSANASREHIRIVGSSTVYPFTTAVAERFGRMTHFRTPLVESTGSGSGLVLFCSGVGTRTVDMTNASRRIKPSETDLCRRQGVDEIIEMKIGYDGIVLANSLQQPPLSISLSELYLALAKHIPNPDGSDTLVSNPYTRWNEINPALPDVMIEVLGPPPTSGTRDALVELAMKRGCQAFAYIQRMKLTDEHRYHAVCHGMREDGGFVEVGENDNLIVQKLVSSPNVFGIFGFSFLEQNRDKVRSVAINGVTPTLETIADGRYPVSRSMFLYIKKAHVGVIPGIESFMTEYLSESAMGPYGYLAERGMIPMRDSERATVIERVMTRETDVAL